MVEGSGKEYHQGSRHPFLVRHHQSQAAPLFTMLGTLYCDGRSQEARFVQRPTALRKYEGNTAAHFACDNCRIISPDNVDPMADRASSGYSCGAMVSKTAVLGAGRPRAYARIAESASGKKESETQRVASNQKPQDRVQVLVMRRRSK